VFDDDTDSDTPCPSAGFCFFVFITPADWLFKWYNEEASFVRWPGKAFSEAEPGTADV
jgi:hypothetical protein